MQRAHAYFIGIGGIGVSALARLYRRCGWRVSGSDLARSEITDALTRESVRVFIGPHCADHVAPSVTRVIYTAAAKPDNPELRAARRYGIKTLSLAQAVGELTRQYDTIAITGSHGKSTTTALAALALIRGGLDPTVQIGTKLKEFGNANARIGTSHWLVLEADEYRNKFLHYTPAVAVVTNVDREHLDFYKNIRNIETAFLKFLSRIRPDGTAVLNRDDPCLRRIGVRLGRARPDIRLAWYSLRQSQARRIANILRIPGRHNVSNALAAYTAARTLNVPTQTIFQALGSYRGSWRRFDYQGLLAGAKVFADYAHHPTEIKATLQAAREKFPRARIWCVFQPHHYERLRRLFPEFSRAFGDCHALVLLDVYEVAGRERRRRSPAVGSSALARAVARRGTPALYLPDSTRLGQFLKRSLRRGDVLLMMGAGDIWGMTKALMHSERRKG